MVDDAPERRREGALIAARLRFLGRWTEARRVKFAAYQVAEAGEQAEMDAGGATAMAEAHRLELRSAADVVEAIELDAAGTEYTAAVSAAKAIGRA